MTKPNVAKFFNNVRTSVSKHSPEILTGIGIAGMITTAVLAVKATPKALTLIDAEKARRNEKLLNEARRNNDENYAPLKRLPAVDVVKTCWKCYVPAVVTCAASTACLIGANSVHTRRHAALATAYKLSETALTEYREKVVETIGEKKEQVVREKVAEEQIKKNPVTSSEVVVTGNGDTRFFDPMSGRHFTSSVEKVKRAENIINKRMLHDIFGYASLNDFYDELDLPATEMGEILGWNTEHLIDMDVCARVDDDGQPSIVLDYKVRPNYDYDR